MKSPKFFHFFRRVGTLVLAMVLVLAVSVPAEASENKTAFQEIFASHDGAEFTYELFLTDQNGMSVHNPRDLSAGDTLFVEIRLTRENFTESSYGSFGIEFRLLTRGLAYNNDGTTLRSGTQVRKAEYMDGDSVGFAWYDMAQKGENFANPVLAATWSYTVSDPAMINITVPVALIYVTGDTEDHVPVGNARLFLDVNGGKLIGKDVSGEYPSGTVVTLPDAEFGDYVFDGWSDGVHLYPAGSQYTVSGIVTLTAQWSGLVRDRYVKFLPEGGEFAEADPSGYYADGEIIVMPEATREGYRLMGWSDGTNTYAPGEEYTVSNTVNLTAVWEPVETEGSKTEDESGSGGCCQWCWILGLLLLFLLILLLWKRRYVKYSLVNGDVKLNYKNGEQDVRVAVVLVDEEKQHPLSKSGTVQAKSRLRYITNFGRYAIAPVEPGKYDGKLIIMEGETVTVKKCRIKVLDKELKK